MTFILLMAAVAAPRAVAADAGDEQYAVAARHYSDQRWELAVQEFQLLRDKYPDHSHAAEANFFIAEAYVQLDRYEESRKRFDAFLDSAADHPLARRALFRRGEVSYLSGHAEQARTDLQEFLKRYPDDTMAAYALPYLAAAVLSQAEQGGAGSNDLAREAEKYYNEALTRFGDGPQVVECQFGLARAQHRQQKLDEAAAAYAQLVDVQAETIRQPARYYLATIRFGQDRFEEASQHFAQLLAGQPDSRWSAAALGPLAICQARLGRFDDARATFESWQADANHPETKAALAAHLAEAAFEAEQWVWAEQLFGVLVDSNDAQQYRARGLSGLAWTQYRLQRPGDALVTFGRLLEDHPKDPLAAESAFMRATLLEQHAKQPDEALAAYRGLLKQYPDCRDEPTAMFRAAALHESRGEGKAAAELYEQLVEKYGQLDKQGQLVDKQAANGPRIAAARYRLAWLLKDLGREDDSAAQFQAIRDHHRDSEYWPDAVFRLAERSYQRKEYDAVRQTLTELVASKPAAAMLAHALYLDAIAAQAAGDWQAMETSLARLVAEMPESPLQSVASFWLAEAAYHQDHFDDAKARFDELARGNLHKDEAYQPTILLRRAQLLALEQKWSECLRVAEQLVQRYPASAQLAEACYLVGRSLAAQARFSEARIAYLKAAPRDGSSKTETAAMAQWMIGESYMHQEKYQEALREYLRVEALYAFPKWQAAALLQGAKCYEQLAQPQQAAELYRQIVQKYPQTEFVDEANQRLGRLPTD